MKEKINYLKESPIYAMSLGSKELFHSNFWHWLMTCEDIKPKNAFVEVFFDLKNINGIKNGDIKREQSNRDITIWCDNKAYVIENKLKSVPYKGQLLEYETKLEKCQSFGFGVLTGIFMPEFMKDEDCKNWKFISYKQIGERIIKILDKVECSTPNKLIIEEYANIIIMLYDIVNEKLAKTEKLLQYKDCRDLEEIKLDDVCKKYSAENFAKFFNDTILEELRYLIKDLPNCKINPASSGFTRKSSLNDFRITVNEENIQKKFEIGIQIQDSEYRIVAIRFGKMENKKVYEDFLENGWFHKIEKIDKQKFINGKITSLRKKDNFCKYEKPGDEGYHFIYQHWNIYDYTFEYLKNEIFSDLKKAIEIIKHIV